MSLEIQWRRLLFAMSNALINTVSAFSRSESGRLTFLGSFPTGGQGTGAQSVDPLGSQGSLVLSGDGRLLFAVNAGDNTISMFRVLSDSLELLDRVPSYGVFPSSLTVKGRLLYVLNAGDAQHPANITGFTISAYGRLCHLRGSTRPLSTAAAQPACIVFDPCGEVLAVTEKADSVISTFLMEGCNTPGDARVSPSNGAIPFGSAFLGTHVLLVSEAGPDALSSYFVSHRGELTVISGSIPNGQEATCWVAVTPDRRYAYTSNAGNGTVTRYRIANDGTLAALESLLTTPQGGSAPLDNGIDRAGRYLYVLNGNGGSISVFRIHFDGELTLIEVFLNTGLPQLGAQGIAVL